MVVTFPARLKNQPGLMTAHNNVVGAMFSLMCGWKRTDGQYGCGGQLGMFYSLDPESGDWEVQFARDGGWVESDGIWKLSRHAEKQLRYVSRLASSSTTDPDRAWYATELLRRNQATRYRRYDSRPVSPSTEELLADLTPSRTPGSRSTTPPCLIRCPRCRRVNRVDDALIAEAESRYHRDMDEWQLEHLSH